jgi:hypothetical protein
MIDETTDLIKVSTPDLEEAKKRLWQEIKRLSALETKIALQIILRKLK